LLFSIHTFVSFVNLFVLNITFLFHFSFLMLFLFFIFIIRFFILFPVKNSIKHIKLINFSTD
jgi:hypothetical protein